MNPLTNVKKIFMPTSIGNKIKEFGEKKYGSACIKVDINDLLERIDYLHKDIKRDNILFGKMKDDSLIQKYNEIVFIINQLTLLMYDMDSDLRNAIVMSDNSKLKSKTISLLKEFMELRQLYF